MIVQLQKIYRDLWIYRLRTFLSVFAIFVGLVVFGAVATARNLLTDSYNQAFQEAHPAQVVMQIPAFDRSLMDQIAESEDAVTAVDARFVASDVRMSVGPDEWISLELHGIEDFSSINLNRLFPEANTQASAPAQGTLWLDRSILQRNSLAIGDTVVVQAANGDNHDLRISGFVNDVIAYPTQLINLAVGYVTLDTLQDMELAVYERPRQPAFNQLYLRFNTPTEDITGLRQAVEAVTRRLEFAGYQVTMTDYLSDEPPLATQMVALDTVLILSTILSFGVTGVMISNFVSAIVGRQMTEIGIMKSLGAVPTQIMLLFFIMMIMIGLIAYIPAFLLTKPLAEALTLLLVNEIDISIKTIAVPLNIRLIQFAAAILIPLAAALIPVIQGSLVSVQQILRSDGNAIGLLGRLMAFMTGAFLPVIILQMAIRNVFLKPGRFLLTTASLTLPGALFIAAFGIQTSLQTLDTSLANCLYDYDIEFVFDGDAPIKRIQRLTEQQPEVLYTEVWRQGVTHRIFPAGYGSDATSAAQNISDKSHEASSSGDILLRGVPVDSQIIDFPPQHLLKGKWLSDNNQILLTYEGYQELGLDVDSASSVLMETALTEKQWEVAGVTSSMAFAEGFIDIDTFESLVPRSLSTVRLVIVTNLNDISQINELIRTLHTIYQKEHIDINSETSMADFMMQRAGRIGIVTQALIISAIMIGIVSMIGLISTISINTRERTKSIGILRSLGGDYRHLGTMVLFESLTIVLMSYALAFGLSYFVGWQVSNMLAQQLYLLSATYGLEGFGAIVWFGVIVVIGIVAAIGPAWYAINITISDTLRYEG